MLLDFVRVDEKLDDIGHIKVETMKIKLVLAHGNGGFMLTSGQPKLCILLRNFQSPLNFFSFSRSN